MSHNLDDLSLPPCPDLTVESLAEIQATSHQLPTPAPTAEQLVKPTAEDDIDGAASDSSEEVALSLVVAQLGVPESDALALLRAHAYSHDQSVSTTAHAVVTRAVGPPGTQRSLSGGAPAARAPSGAT